MNLFSVLVQGLLLWCFSYKEDQSRCSRFTWGHFHLWSFDLILQVHSWTYGMFSFLLMALRVNILYVAFCCYGVSKSVLSILDLSASLRTIL